VSNQKYTKINKSAEAALALPCHAGTRAKTPAIEDNEKTGPLPALPKMSDLPITADLPMLPEFQARARAINWRAILTTVILASSLVVIAGVGCGTGGTNMLKATTTATATPTLDKALWAANGANVVEFIPSQLTAGSTDPAPHLSINSSVFGAPHGVTFDAAGNLWVTRVRHKRRPLVQQCQRTQHTHRVQAIPALLYQLPHARGHSEHVAIATNQTLAAPNGIAFGNLGDPAAISPAAPFGVAGFQKTQLVPVKSGPAPNPFLVGPTTTFNAPAGCNFGPVVD